MLEINVGIVPVGEVEVEVVAVQQTSRPDNCPRHSIPFNQVCDGVQKFDGDVDRRQGELKAANTGSCATVQQAQREGTRANESGSRNWCLAKVLTVVNMMARNVNPRTGNRAA